ncbi:hypothetical protein HZA57_07915 [Candidatus Poribacteria bacterium]|nr:hypothetical protein [Candidatus Poribacteria bacterium]
MIRLRRQPRTSRTVARDSGKAPKRGSELRVAELLAIVSCGAVAAGLGLLHVNAGFRTRDYEFETRRLQELEQVRHDEVSRLEARLGMLKRKESLRDAALAHLGMVEPASTLVGEVEVNPDRVTAFREASERARTELEGKRQTLATLGKEAF